MRAVEGDALNLRDLIGRKAVVYLEEELEGCLSRQRRRLENQMDPCTLWQLSPHEGPKHPALIDCIQLLERLCSHGLKIPQPRP